MKTEATIATLIVDDEPLARRNVRVLLDAIPDITVVGECNSGLTALDFLLTNAVDLLFLDIQMPEFNGFEVLEQLSPARLPRVVFVTAYDQFALKAFEVNAVDYLLKPFTNERFYRSLAQARRELDQRRNDPDPLERLRHYYRRQHPYRQRLPVRQPDLIRLVNVADINWLRSQENYVEISTSAGRHLVRDTLKNLEQQLDPCDFVRIHRSVIVNLHGIETLEPLFNGEYRVTLRDRSQFRLSRTYRDKLAIILDEDGNPA